MIRPTPFCFFSLLIAALGVAGCSASNEPATSSGSDGGTTSTGNGTTGSGGSTTPGDNGTSADGGSSNGDTGGDNGASTGGDNGGEHGEFEPPCAHFRTEDGVEPAKGVACSDDDVQLCYRTCGPLTSGWKEERCLAGAYAEGDCMFPTADDYACFAIPETIDDSCPTDVRPRASEDCEVAECTPCNLGGEYEDSGGTPKSGWCVCSPGGSWSCGSDSAWPCPHSQGC